MIPFVYTQGGLFSVDNSTLVAYPDHVVVAYVPKAPAGSDEPRDTPTASDLFEVR